MARVAVWVEEEDLDIVSGHLAEWNYESGDSLPAVFQDIYEQVVAHLTEDEDN